MKLPNYTANVHIIYNACAVSIFFSRALAAAGLFYRLLVAVYCQILQLPTPNKHSLTHKGGNWGRKFFNPLKLEKMTTKKKSGGLIISGFHFSTASGIKRFKTPISNHIISPCTLISYRLVLYTGSFFDPSRFVDPPTQLINLHNRAKKISKKL